MAPQFLRVVVNRAGRYALWPHARPTPAGWTDTHFIGSRTRCLAQVGELSRGRGAPTADAVGRPPPPPDAAGRPPTSAAAQTLTGLLASVTADAPNASAIVHEGRRTSFRDLDRRSSALARLLAEHGVRPRDTVGLRLRAGVDAVVGRLAVLKAGAAYLPLPAGHPAGRARVGLRLVLSEPEWAASERRHAAPVLAWRHRDPTGRALVRAVRTDDPAYVVTGAVPLGGLLLAHRHLVVAGRSATAVPSPGPQAGTPPAGPGLVAPGAAEGALWGPLLRGDEVALDPVTGNAPMPPAPPPLDALTLDALTADALTVDTPLVEALTVDALTVGPLPVGRWQVLDDDLRPAPTGRLHVGAAWLGQVAADDPVRSAQWLVPDPSDPSGDTTLLATGWRAEQAPTGPRLLRPRD
ncbi:AMP-binding protein [Micromonospora sp. NBC_01412]|uniref:AMP-binding protein n=1 Tax=Micromonospora sp. NBC_01412 TaxID=2903590 RepID=UPI00324325C3